VENLDDAIVIDGFPAFSNLASAGRTGNNVFSQQLAAALTEFHDTLAAMLDRIFSWT
jgi:hypothetical protein